MKKILITLSIIMIVACGVAYAANFSDVEGHWGAKYINALADRGIINGYTDGTFKPNGEIKKSEFLKLIMTTVLPDYDWTAPNTVYNHWASAYIDRAVMTEVIPSDYVDSETVNEEITRADVVKILGKCDIMIAETPQDGAKLEFYDILDLDRETQLMLSHCVARGLITGYEDATFKPNKTLTRAEVATILYRYLGLGE